MGLLYRTLLKQLMQWTVQSHRDAGRPALAGYAFDHITVKMHLDGRFAHHEIELLERKLFPQLPQGGVCLDVGANIGNHAVNFAPYFGAINAFEPNEKALDLLRINAKLRDNITVHGVGLSDRAQTLEVAQPAHNLGGTGAAAVGSSKDAQVVLSLIALDSLDLDLKDRPITFVKIDVEGFEAEVIKGAARTLTLHRPVIGMEVDRRSVNEGSSPAIDAAFDLGYKHMYAMMRGNVMRIKEVERATARNYPLLLLSMEPLSL